MCSLLFARTGAVAAAIAVAASVMVVAEGQNLPAAERARAGSAQRTSDGRPDLQGIWSFATLTPLERPENLTGKDTLTDEEAAQLERQEVGRRVAADAAPRPGSVGGYNQFWYEFGSSVSPDKRTSLIIDPPDGRMPALTPEAQKRAQVHKDRLSRPAFGPEDRDAPERCLLGYNSGPPMVPVGYNQNMQLVQTGDHVMVLNEMVHDARIIPLDGRPHVPSNIRPWMGDSRGRWEGDTLVVETTNFTDQTWNQFNRWNWASDENMRLTERFSRVGPDTLRYEFTVDDPTTWTRPWTAAILMTRTDDQIYEYACHEGNHGMMGILRGARAIEKFGTDASKVETSGR